jgi:hypothetical protein
MRVLLEGRSPERMPMETKRVPAEEGSPSSRRRPLRGAGSIPAGEGWSVDTFGNNEEAGVAGGSTRW